MFTYALLKKCDTSRSRVRCCCHAINYETLTFDPFATYIQIMK